MMEFKQKALKFIDAVVTGVAIRVISALIEKAL